MKSNEYSPAERVEYLTEQLNYHNYKYYVEDSPEITDFEFDALLRDIEQLEEEYPDLKRPNSPTMRVGG